MQGMSAVLHSSLSESARLHSLPPELLGLQEIEVPDAADAAAQQDTSDPIRKYKITRLTPVLIVCEWLGCSCGGGACAPNILNQHVLNTAVGPLQHNMLLLNVEANSWVSCACVHIALCPCRGSPNV
jgi:hypothetical protein